MKIGILTFHDGMNHGGFLQAYAMALGLKGHGVDAQIIHYRNLTHFLQEYRWMVVRYNPVNIFRNLAKIALFKRAQRLMPLTPFTTSVAKVAAMKFDTIIVGSDVVWNFQWPALGGERIYFGEGLEGSRLVAYAPSFGPSADAEEIPLDIIRGLQGFHSLSVRDDRSLALLKGILPDRRIERVLDPTFLVDWNKECRPCKLPGRYLLVYAYSLTQEQIRIAKQHARTHGLTTVAIGYSQPWCDWNKMLVGPFEFLYCFQNASAVLSSTFHGTLFSIQFRKSFYTINNRSIEAKTRGLLQDLKLEERLGGGEMMSELLTTALVDDGLDAELKRSSDVSNAYLSNALKP